MEPYEQDYCEYCGRDYSDCQCCPGCGAETYESCRCCRRCNGEGKVVLNEIEWNYRGDDWATCPECGGNGAC